MRNKSTLIKLIFLALFVLTLTACGEKLSEREDVEITDVHILVPDGFQEVSENMWLLNAESDDRSSINLTISPHFSDKEDYTKESIRQLMLDAYEQQGLEIENFENTDIDYGAIDGFDTAQYEMTYLLQGIPIHQIQLIIFSQGDDYTFTFTAMDNESWIDAFQESIDSIKIEYNEI